MPARSPRYRRVAGEVFLEYLDCDPGEPAPTGVDVDISLEWENGAHGKPDLTVEAHQGGERVGECGCHSICGYSEDERARDWFFFASLGVEERFQGRYLGKHLLQRAMLEMRGVGYRHAAISTAADNHRAFLFYSNVGYSVSDWTFGLGKVLSGTRVDIR